ncbi:MAG: ATP-binding protein [Glaciecola sp.]|nr:ATP-binding protein [Glaciecola sp.]MDG1814919.1 ATP-binding protein [Glaciecola sp.]MDG2100183.1 ATP-binding protein [Glaciecola sp.]
MINSLRSKIAIGVTFIEAAFLLFLAVMVTSLVKDILHESLTTKAQISSQLFATMTTDAIVTYDVASLEAFVDVILQQPDIAYARVLGPNNNKVLAQSGTPAILSSSRNFNNSIDNVSDDIFDTYAEVIVDGQLFGRVELGIQTNTIATSIYEIQTVVAGVAFTEIIFVSITSFIFGGYLIRQLTQLRVSAENVTTKLNSGEKITDKINTFDNDKEISVVGEAFNELIDALNKQTRRTKKFQRELFELNESLEEQIVNRTSMLKKSNGKLQEINKSLKETQTQLGQAEKMASVGQLAAGVAHEINNPIGFVKSNVESLQGYNDSFAEIILSLQKFISSDDVFERRKLNQEIQTLLSQHDIDFILEDSIELIKESKYGLERVSDIIAGMKAFSRADDDNKQWFNINNCIETTLKMVSNQLKYHCEINTELDQSIPNIEINVGKIIQVLTNLLVNAGQAIVENGKIAVKSSMNNGFVEIAITDNGSGISKENLTQLFDPFFTTKPEGEGTGLGLSISFNIIREHGGEILVNSELGVGTCFTIRLPENSVCLLTDVPPNVSLASI